MPLPDQARLIAALTASGCRLVVIATGGGATVIPHLVTTPGAGGVVLDALVPYSRDAVNHLLGGPQESFCSPATARRLAAAAWQRASLFDAAAGGRGAEARAVGLAVTASLRTTRPKRGCHRVCVAVHSLAATLQAEVVLEKDARSRADEELVAAAASLDLLADATGLPDDCRGRTGDLLRPGERIDRDSVEAPPSWRDLVAGGRSVAAAVGEAMPAAGMLVFPGSFDPLHDGHLGMARIAEEIAERPVAWEMSIANVDKPLLDHLTIRDRAAQFHDRPLWLTRAPRFLDKLEIFPEATFVMGADTYARLVDPRYYGGSRAAAAEAADEIASRARGLIVFGRTRDGEFQDAERIEAPRGLRDASYFVSRREFRLDLSSTELRRRERERREAACET